MAFGELIGDARKRFYVKPGQQLQYVDKLMEAGRWPPKRSPNRLTIQPPPKPALTPLLVVSAMQSDSGQRPISGDQAYNCQSIQLLETDGRPVTSFNPNGPSRIRVSVTNRGGIGAFGGLAEFYQVTATFDPKGGPDGKGAVEHAIGHVLGYAGFTAMPGATVVIDCPKLWTPGPILGTSESILAPPSKAPLFLFHVVVQVYDMFLDRLTQPFDSRQDRHVGWRNYSWSPPAGLTPFP